MAREDAPPLVVENHHLPPHERIKGILMALVSHAMTLKEALEKLEAMVILSEDRERWGRRAP